MGKEERKEVQDFHKDGMSEFVDLLEVDRKYHHDCRRGFRTEVDGGQV